MCAACVCFPPPLLWLRSGTAAASGGTGELRGAASAPPNSNSSKSLSFPLGPAPSSLRPPLFTHQSQQRSEERRRQLGQRGRAEPLLLPRAGLGTAGLGRDALEAEDAMGWEAMGWDGMRGDARGCEGMWWEAVGSDGMLWEAMGCDEKRWDGDVMDAMGGDGMGSDGMRWEGMGCDGKRWDAMRGGGK